MHQKLITFNQSQRKDVSVADLRAGDVIRVFRKIKEGGKERLQTFQGSVIALRGGQSSSPTVTVRKVSFGVGVELVLPLLSPQVGRIEFVKRTRARRAKLYYVRDKSVKVLSKKLKEVVIKGKIPFESAGETEAPATDETASAVEAEVVVQTGKD